MNILILSGLDPVGGAGISVDVKVARSLGLHPLPIVTTLTVQNTCGVREVFPVDSKILEKQLSFLLEDANVSAVKIGLISSTDTSKVLLDFIKNIDSPKVLDPIIYAGAGGKIGCEDAYKMLMSHVDVITPNFTEAKILSGKSDVIEAGKELKKLTKAVIITGGELGGKDHVFEEKNYTVEAEFIKISIHGTGCVYSTALACYLAKGRNLEDSTRLARIFVLESVKKALKVGKCRLCVNP
ncbi:MAG: hydroxymethylpyrimidine/phosphomethylpyrimidine kinase [Archaeoglobaceae archaeon]|nr:hydroxymethylpyrimidine/phosphomethylpyrimidine kinase [Archaeoglobaceae archaeon]MCX8152660.1 hydroxymethylpyrimidine/phosphomethylpyrimidine kinase [Archaeoglobaceae archaeon]MDW8013661.1 bifunctional hydroxymethylpyrimidine kinase/phosphomethylpyrimidine kinase [Archaeoglobaceae archaeon]